MSDQNTFDPKYAALGVAAILLSITVLVILPKIIRTQLSKIGKN